MSEVRSIRANRHGHERSRRRDTRSLSPAGDDRSHGRHSRSRRESERKTEQTRLSGPTALPFDTKPLSKSDLTHYRPLFAMYLDIQKNIDIEDVNERELKGRWKSFVGKCHMLRCLAIVMLTNSRNRGELAEGWYDPGTFEKAHSSAYSHSSIRSPQPGVDPEFEGHRDASPRGDRLSTSAKADERFNSPAPPTGRTFDVVTNEGIEEDEGYGPQLPSGLHLNPMNEKSGPTIPTMQDLQLRREEDLSSREDSRTAQNASNKYDRQLRKSELRAVEDEIAPRAEAGTRERQLEKRKEVASSNKTFAESRRGGSPGAAVPDAELMGGSGDGRDDLETLKQTREKETRKKNEREIRKEEILRARAAEREERLRSYHRKEEETMDFLRTLAKQRFG